LLTQGLFYDDDCNSLLPLVRDLNLRVTRAIGVVDISMSDSELDRLQELGVCGSHLNLHKNQATDDVEKQIDLLTKYSARIQSRKWCVNICPTNAACWTRLVEVVPSLKVRVVADDHAALRGWSILAGEIPDEMSQPGLRDVKNLLKTGYLWIKLNCSVPIFGL
jgi:hypothetical protein